MSDKAKFEALEDGPLVVRGISSLVGSDGTKVKPKAAMFLCRCGQSKNKPFCDGTHKQTGFKGSGGKAEGKDVVLPYAGEEVTVYFNPRLCSHAAECNRLSPHVFDATKRPWITPDEGSLEDVEKVIESCPSGALTMSAPGGAPEHRISDRPEVVVQKDGPYWVTGVTRPTDAQGEGASKDKYVLCRCGLSGNKPYCDGTHRSAGWQDNS